MINPPKTKIQYLASERENRAEAEKCMKDVRFQEGRIMDMRFRLSRAESELRGIKDSARKYERETAALLSSALSLESEARRLQSSPNPSERARASSVFSQADGMKVASAAAASKAMSEKGKANRLESDVSFFQRDIRMEEGKKKDFEAKFKRFSKEADIYHQASLKAL